jgi:hypothetical protein
MHDRNSGLTLCTGGSPTLAKPQQLSMQPVPHGPAAGLLWSRMHLLPTISMRQKFVNAFCGDMLKEKSAERAGRREVKMQCKQPQYVPENNCA